MFSFYDIIMNVAPTKYSITVSQSPQYLAGVLGAPLPDFLPNFKAITLFELSVSYIPDIRRSYAKMARHIAHVAYWKAPAADANLANIF